MTRDRVLDAVAACIAAPLALAWVMWQCLKLAVVTGVLCVLVPIVERKR